MEAEKKFYLKIGNEIIKSYGSFLEAEAHAEFLINMGDDELISIEEGELV